ncbi:MAG: amidohydrolase family protein [Cyclobacteriaceae bacterium]
MKKIKCLFSLLVSLSLPVFGWAQENVQQIEALFYLDHLPVRVEVTEGRISKITRIRELSDNDSKVYIAPGLIDNQVNGYMGVSFVDMGEDLSMEGIKKATKALWKDGVTSYLPTLTTNKKEIYLKNLALLAKAMEDPEIRGAIPGFHMEGPYISPVDGYRGAHPLVSVRKPDWEEFMELYEASEGNILQFTLAPEVEGGMDFISKLNGKGIVIAIGHHNGSAAEIREAVDRGAKMSTHLGNGMANSINRHRNPLWPQLAEDRLTVSIIADGFHLQPEQLRVFYRAKGLENTIITSDVSALGGMPPGKYLNVIGDTLELTPDGAVVYPAQNNLAGSGSPLSKGIGNMMKATGCTLGEAIQMASGNPARLNGFKDRGAILPGMRADLVLFTLEDFEMKIKKTIVNGELVYEADE